MIPRTRVSINSDGGAASLESSEDPFKVNSLILTSKAGPVQGEVR